MEVKERKILLLKLSNGQVPFDNWYETLDLVFKRAVDARLTRLQAGNFGDRKSVGAGVFELRIPKGPGLRIYYGICVGDLVVLLICAGNKRSQHRDIKAAKILWRKWSNENKQ